MNRSSFDAALPDDGHIDDWIIEILFRIDSAPSTEDLIAMANRDDEVSGDDEDRFLIESNENGGPMRFVTFDTVRGTQERALRHTTTRLVHVVGELATALARNLVYARMNTVDIIDATLGIHFADELTADTQGMSEVDWMQIPDVIPTLDVTEIVREYLLEGITN